MNAYQVVRDFEKALCEYTGAPYAVTVTSCTMALLLAVAWHLRNAQAMRPIETIDGRPNGGWWPTERLINIPKRTYISVPMSIIHAGGRPMFRDSDWEGFYDLRPIDVVDCARWFTMGLWPAICMGKKGMMLCVSFHGSKILGDTQGGAILHDNPKADAWFRRMRFDGRTEGVPPNQDNFREIGYHCYMSNDVAARLMLKLASLPKHNAPLPNDDYPDLSTMEIFK